MFIDCFYGYHSALSPEEYLWDEEKFGKYSEEDIMHDLFEIGYVDKAIFQPTYLLDFFPNGFNTTAQDAVLAEKHPDKFILNSSFEPRLGEQGLAEFEREAQEVRLQGREALHRRVARGLEGLEAERLLGQALPGEVPGARRNEHPRPQGADHPSPE